MTTATVNAELRKRGYRERLFRSRSRRGDYFYWGCGDAAMFEESIVGGVSHIDALTIDQWVADLTARKVAREKTS